MERTDTESPIMSTSSFGCSSATGAEPLDACEGPSSCGCPEGSACAWPEGAAWPCSACFSRSPPSKAEVGGTSASPPAATTTSAPAPTAPTACVRSQSGSDASSERIFFTRRPKAPWRKGFSTKRYDSAAQPNTAASCSR